MWKKTNTSREYLKYANIAPVFDRNGTGTYTFSFDLKSEIAGTIQVYPTDGLDVKYTYPAKNIEVSTEYKRYSMTVEVSLNRETDTNTSLSFYGAYDSGRFPSVKNVKIERGNIATDWTPAPEDTEQKITTLNQQIEFIDGQLSAKLEQTDLLPINNKITEYGNSLTANAQSIESLISKTLHPQ